MDRISLLAGIGARKFAHEIRALELLAELPNHIRRGDAFCEKAERACGHALAYFHYTDLYDWAEVWLER